MCLNTDWLCYKDSGKLGRWEMSRGKRSNYPRRKNSCSPATYFMLKLANVKEKHGIWFLLLLYWPLRERQQKLLLLTCLIIVLPILGCFSSGSSLLSVKHFHSHGAWSDARSCWSRWLVRHTCGSDGVVGFGSCRVSLQVYLLPAERALAGCLYSLAQPKLLHFGSAFAGAEGDVLGDVFRKLIAKTIVPFG